MEDISVSSKGGSMWGRNRYCQLSGLNLSFLPGLEAQAVTLAGLDTHGRLSPSAYMKISAEAMDDLARKWLESRGLVVQDPSALEQRDDPRTTDPMAAVWTPTDDGHGSLGL